jgi:hypothetical protein
MLARFIAKTTCGHALISPYKCIVSPAANIPKGASLPLMAAAALGAFSAAYVWMPVLEDAKQRTPDLVARQARMEKVPAQPPHPDLNLGP